MKAYLVDTNVLSELTRPAPNPAVTAFSVNAGNERLYISVVTIGEIAKGIAIMPEGKRRASLQAWLDNVMRPWFAGRVLPVTEAIAERWAVIAAQRRHSGRHLTMADGLIAATAIEHGLTLVTRNAKDFEGVGVGFLNPWMPGGEPQ